MTAADGAGPEYCKVCRAKRKSDEPCTPSETTKGSGCVQPELLEENVPAVVLFLGVQTQWRHSFGGPTGLDYVGVEAAARLRGVEMTPELFSRIQVLEQAWLGGVADRAARERLKDS